MQDLGMSPDEHVGLGSCFLDWAALQDHEYQSVPLELPIECDKEVTKILHRR